MCPPSADPHTTPNSVAEVTEVRDRQSWGFGKEKPASFRVLGVWSGNLEDFMEEVPFGKQSRILREGEVGRGGGESA